ncbi:hypothetical protein V6N12_071172 [Hibiscus sabdariffa]|uniref:Uncharacterized protein n=1 Tax=Hibiscus sabdariffa TaxID=183260 RepID=A0ABR2FJ02_9ROSI
MYVIGSLEEEEPIYFQQPKDYIGLYSNTTAYQTLKSSTLVGKRLTTDCLEETSKGLRANESLSFGDSTSWCFFFRLLQLCLSCQILLYGSKEIFTYVI